MHDGTDMSRYSEDAVKQIITRAMELDRARAESISERDLHLIARELGIDESSIDRAIAERNAPSPPAVVSALAAMTPSSRIPFLMMASGALAGIMSRGSWNFIPASNIVYSALATMLVLQAGTVAVATLYRGPARHERFQLSNAALWSGYGLGWTLLHGNAPIYFMETLLPFVALGALAGSATIWLREVVQSARQKAGSSGPAGPSSSDRTATFAGRVRAALKTLLRPFLRVESRTRLDSVAKHHGIPAANDVAA